MATALIPFQNEEKIHLGILRYRNSSEFSFLVWFGGTLQFVWCIFTLIEQTCNIYICTTLRRVPYHPESLRTRREELLWKLFPETVSDSKFRKKSFTIGTKLLREFVKEQCCEFGSWPWLILRPRIHPYGTVPNFQISENFYEKKWKNAI